MIKRPQLLLIMVCELYTIKIGLPLFLAVSKVSLFALVLF